MPVAYVQPKPGATVTEQELLEHAARTIPERAAIPNANPEDGVIPKFPSSTPRVMMIANRVLFKLLETISQQVAGVDDDLFGELTAKAVVRGDFTIVRSQSCCYFPVEHVPRFLQFLTVLFGHTITTTDGVVDLATQLGLRFRLWTDSRTRRVKGVLFEKRHGKKSVFSLVFYDKQKRVAQMRQGQTLTETETGLIRENVRFDITAHGPGIMRIIAAARRFLEKHPCDAPRVLGDLPAKEFLEGTPEQTARWFERACYVLSHKLTNGVRQRKSFAAWLVPQMIRKALRLTSVVRCTPEGLRTFAEIDDPVAKAWHAAEKYDPDGWARQLGTESGVGKTAFYKRRKARLAKYNIDIAIPYAFYRDLEFFGPNSLTKPEARAALIAAIGQGDGEDTLRLLGEASANFFAQMADVVGKPISGTPTLLPTKVAGRTLTALGHHAGAVSREPAPAPRLGVRREPLGEPPNSRSESKPRQNSSIEGAVGKPATALSAGGPRGGPKDRSSTIGRGAPPKSTKNRPQPKVLDSQAERRKAIVQARINEKRKRTRRENKRAARWERMSGPR